MGAQHLNGAPRHSDDVEVDEQLADLDVATLYRSAAALERIAATLDRIDGRLAGLELLGRVTIGKVAASRFWRLVGPKD